jgi:hypothetical protein
MRRDFPRWTLAFRRLSCHQRDGGFESAVDESTVAVGNDTAGGGGGGESDGSGAVEGTALKSPKMFISWSVPGRGSFRQSRQLDHHGRLNRG